MQSTGKKIFFNFMADQSFVEEHFKRDFEIDFYLKTMQNLVAEHYKRDFNMVFHFMATQNLVAEHYEKGYVDWPCCYGDEQR